MALTDPGGWSNEPLLDRLADTVEPWRRAVLRRRRMLGAGCAGLTVVAALSVLAPPAPIRRGVVVAAEALRPGTRLAAADLRTAGFPAGLVPAGAFSSSSRVLGRTVATDVPAGEPLTGGVLLGPSVVPAGRVLTVVRLSDPAGSAGLRPGDLVDVLGARAGAPTAQVLAGRIRLVALPADPTGTGGLLLLCVSPRQALTLAASDGLRLSVTLVAER
jgi:pilus assembly protein CpaB